MARSRPWLRWSTWFPRTSHSRRRRWWRWVRGAGFAVAVAGLVSATTPVRNPDAGVVFTLLDGADPNGVVTRVRLDVSVIGAPVVGNWDRARSGRDTVGISVPAGVSRRWLLASGNTPTATVRYDFWWGHPECLEVTGDWQGTGDSIGEACRDAAADTWMWRLAGQLTPDGPLPFRTYHFGSTLCAPVVGDWNGDGVTTVGVSCPQGTVRQWSLTDSVGEVSGVDPKPSHAFRWGDAACRPATGNWDGRAFGGADGTTVGEVCSNGGTWHWVVTDHNETGGIARSFDWGPTTQGPVVGNWDGQPGGMPANTGDGDDTPGTVTGLEPPF